MADRNIPVESLKMDDRVMEFCWEPSGVRMSIVHEEEGRQKNQISFYSMGKASGGKSLDQIRTLKEKQASRVFWAPLGGNCVLSNFENIAGHLEFYDVDNGLSMANVEHFMCNVVAWDPSGRQLCTAVCQPIGGGSLRYDMENGESFCF